MYTESDSFDLQQRLENAVRQGKYLKAVALAAMLWNHDNNDLRELQERLD